MERNSFVLFTEIVEVIKELTNEQKGILFQTILDYQLGIEPEIDDPIIKIAFIPIKQNLDRNNEKWERTRAARSEAGKKGMRSRWDNKAITNDNKNNKAISEITKITVNVNDNANVNVNENVNDKDKVDYQLIADMYNNTCVSFPRLTKLSDSRKKAIRARLNKYSVEDIQKAFEMAEASDFLKGSNNRNWSANFDWLMNDSNLAKVLDGNYKNKTSKIEMDGKLREFINKNQVVDFGM
jgi:hypothetical protein